MICYFSRYKIWRRIDMILFWSWNTGGISKDTNVGIEGKEEQQIHFR